MRKLNYGIGASVAAMLLAGAIGIVLFSSHQKAQVLSQWREKLEGIASSQAQAVNRWVDGQFQELTTLANNASLQIYFSSLAGTVDEPTGQADYLRNQLNAAAQRLSITPPDKSQAVTPSQNAGGLALVTMDGTIVMASEGMPALDNAQIQSLISAPRGEKQLIASPSAASANMLFSVPVYPVQSDRDAASQMGVLVGMRPLSQLSPVVELTQPVFEKSLTLSLFNAATNAQALSAGFNETIDARGVAVLEATKVISSTPLALRATIDRAEAFAATAAARNSMLVALASFVLACGMGAAMLQKQLQKGRQRLKLSLKKDAREAGQSQLVENLVSLMDRRDPNTAQHSERTAVLARAMANHMRLAPDMVETVATAAWLSNLGKAHVPMELLTRGSALNEAERHTVRHSLLSSADLVSGIAFTGPVEQTLKQAQEHMDGSGPMQLKGDQIIISARIVSAANAYVSMISPRAYRAAMDSTEALAILASEAGHRFDPRVIDALVESLNDVEMQITVTEQKVA